MDLQEALEFILSGRAILFAGAGFSRGAVNLRGTPFKTGAAFATHLAKLAGLPEDTALEDAAEWFTARHGKDRMVEELQQEFTVKQVTQEQIDVLRYPWKRIYTTNYDNVAETAAARASRNHAPREVFSHLFRAGARDSLDHLIGATTRHATRLG